jgi:hypothetical protein
VNNAVLKHRFYDNGAWSQQWETVDDIANRGIGVTTWGVGRLDVFARGNNTDVANGDTFHKYFSGGTWSTVREDLGGTSTPGVIGATSWSVNRVDVFVHGTDNSVWHKFYG